MFKPKYTLIPEILNNINEIERLYGRLEGLTIPQHLLLNLERDNLIQSVYVSNSIEGNPLSQAEVTNLLLNGRVPVNRDEKEVVNYFKILKTLHKRIGQPFDLNIILDIHKELMEAVNDKIKGKIRNKQIVIGNYGEDNKIIIKHNPPFHTYLEIEQSLKKLLNWIQDSAEPSILKAGLFHHQFVFIHPFEDGNGRVCRLSMALFLLKNKYLINKYFVLDDYYDIDRQQYSDKLHTADFGDKTEWLEYFTNGVKYSLQSALGKIESGLTKLTFDIRPTPKEQEALEIIQKYKEINSADLVKELNITRQQAFNLLRALVKKGYLEKKGSTKSSFYILK
ncbi:Fic family protein [Candidatus Daviesbacteria bacterium]|nr:Fic family protein [Candidatus Daviesbacteria bacterium]